MSLASRVLRQESHGRSLLAALVFTMGASIAIRLAFSDMDPTAAVALCALFASMALAAWRPAIGALLMLAIFSDALYFGTYGVSLPIGQLVPADVLLVGWWATMVVALVSRRSGMPMSSPLTRCIAFIYPGLVLFFFLYTWLSFGAGTQEMLRSARPFLYLTLFIPLCWWLREPGAIDELLGAALAVALGAVGLQLFIYAAGVDVEPFGLFYEWQVWRSAFEGFDRSNQPFFGLNLILIGGIVALAVRESRVRRRVAWIACAGALMVSALISFGRGFWAAMLVAGATAFAIESRRRRRASAIALLAVCAAGVATLAVLAGASGIDLDDLGLAVLDRGALGASSIRYLEGTLGDRYDKINRALILEHPVLGVGFYLGLGTAADIELADTGHNLYADLMLRMGALGLLFFAVLLSIFVRRCRRALSLDLPVAHRAAVIGCLGAAMGNMVWAVSTSHLIYRRGMIEMALMMAVVEVVCHHATRRGAGGDRVRAWAAGEGA